MGEDALAIDARDPNLRNASPGGQGMLMSPIFRLAAIAALLLALAAVALVFTADLESPTQRIEQPIPSERFQR